MAKDEFLTPEKQLLKLIENPKGESLQAESTKRQGKKWFSLGAFRGKFSFSKKTFLERWSALTKLPKSSLGIRQINFVLKLLTLFLFVYFGYSVVVMALELKRASNLIFQYDKSASSFQEPVISNMKEISHYMGKVSARDIFKLGNVSTEIEKEAIVAPTVEESEDQGEQYSLVGISWSKDPEAMIEDTESKRTYFVKKGQPLDPEIKVVAIFKDKVILNYRGREFELS